MQLTVPFIPDEAYIDFLKDRTRAIDSVYFSLHTGPVLDARVRLAAIPRAELISRLARVKNVKKYCLLNTRFIHPERYRDKPFLASLLDDLEALALHNSLDGIVFNDFYLLNALSDPGIDFLPQIEAVPGVNTLIDSVEKVIPLLDMIETTRFKLPGRLILDRSLNRDPVRLKETSRRLKRQFRHMKIELLANEGCIYHCPFKLSHDAHIALANTGTIKNRTHHINSTIGCHAYFHADPARFLKSPFIRPEDTTHYKGMADTIKICGRTLGGRFLTATIRAYIRRSYEGNLFELMDAAHWLSDYYHLDNKKLDPGFFKLITEDCTNACKTCKICDHLFNNTATQKPATIRTYKDYL